jgi:hypothetical protein
LSQRDFGDCIFTIEKFRELSGGESSFALFIPKDYIFHLGKVEVDLMVSQNATPSKKAPCEQIPRTAE